MKNNKRCKNCNCLKREHSYSKPHECLKVVNVTCYQDGRWEVGYCTCKEYMGRK